MLGLRLESNEANSKDNNMNLESHDEVLCSVKCFLYFSRVDIYEWLLGEST